jgi:outer membrane protein assembly factor BamB
MKAKLLYILSLCLVFSVFSASAKDKHLLLGGSGWNKVVIVNKQTKAIEWEYPLEEGWECNSVAVTKKGHILFSYRWGALLVDRDKNVIWDWKADADSEIQTAKVLPDGRFLLAQAGTPAAVIILEEDGTLASRTEIDLGVEQPHSQFRQINMNSRGNFMMPVMGRGQVMEVALDGSVMRSVPLRGGLFCAEPLPNGNWLVACGDSHRYVELNFETGEIVSEVGQNDIEGTTLFFVAQLLHTRGGGLYICNWQGHARDAAESNSPQVMELDAEGNIIWSLNDNHAFGMISAICPVK